MSANLYHRLLSGKPGHSPAVQAGDVALTYRDLDTASARLSHRLVSLGVTVGDRIAVQAEKSQALLILYLASLRVGAVFLPLNTGYTATEVEYFISDATPRLVVIGEGREELAAVAHRHEAVVVTLGNDGRSGSLLDGIGQEEDNFFTVDRDGRDLAAILYTSGTTGRAKGAMLSHDNLGSNAATLVDTWRFTHEDRLLHALPLYHTHGLFVAVNVTLLAGASMNLLPKFDPDIVLEQLPRSTVMMGVPTFYTRLLNDPRLSEAAVATMRLFVSGSAPLLADTHAQWSARTGHAILERYGMTETNMNTSNPYDGERRPGTVGLPLPGVELRIVDEARTELPAETAGMIEVRGPNIFQGYWRQPEKTAEDLREDGWFITGDLGRQSTDGYVEIIGRGKDLIITGGLNVYPKEVELLIDSIPGVEESAVIGVPHADFGEAVVAIVVLQAGSTTNAASIDALLTQRLARFKCPKSIIIVDALPRNTMGKVQKNQLRILHKGVVDN